VNKVFDRSTDEIAKSPLCGVCMGEKVPFQRKFKKRLEQVLLLIFSSSDPLDEEADRLFIMSGKNVERLSAARGISAS
jgi:hypothetical protein